MKKILFKTKKDLIIDYLRLERHYMREYDIFNNGDYSEVEISSRVKTIEELEIMSRKDLIKKINFFQEWLKTYEYMRMLKREEERKEFK